MNDWVIPCDMWSKPSLLRTIIWRGPLRGEGRVGEVETTCEHRQNEARVTGLEEPPVQRSCGLAWSGAGAFRERRAGDHVRRNTT